MNHLFSIAVVLCILCCTVELQAQSPITKCSNLTGHTYYFAGGLLSDDDDEIGWDIDDLKNTSIGLFWDDASEQHSIQYHTSERGWHIPGGKARFELLGISVEQGIGMNLIYLVDYPDNTAELYMFVLHEQKEGQVAVSLMRDGFLINARLFIGKCDPIF